jgi:hypothetical protein
MVDLARQQSRATIFAFKVQKVSERSRSVMVCRVIKDFPQSLQNSQIGQPRWHSRVDSPAVKVQHSYHLLAYVLASTEDNVRRLPKELPAWGWIRHLGEIEPGVAKGRVRPVVAMRRFAGRMLRR